MVAPPKFAARAGDAQTCTLSSPFPHVGGVLQGPGVTTVSIGHMPAAVAGTLCPCAGGLPNAVTMGSTSVMIGFSPAARVGDPTAHGGKIVSGCATVVVGD